MLSGTLPSHQTFMEFAKEIKKRRYDTLVAEEASGKSSKGAKKLTQGSGLWLCLSGHVCTVDLRA